MKGTRLEAAASRFDQTHSLTRTAVGKVTMGLQERWIPIFHALRLSVRGGGPLFGVFCLCYIGLRIGVEYGKIGVAKLVGAELPFIWTVLGQPLSLLGEMVTMVLTMCLLAATFDIASTRVRVLGLNENDRPAVNA
jgi:hypothetical protein